jgi:hypothetical protein
MQERMDEGKYYVGDLCYVFDDKQWAEVCSLTFPFGNASPNRNKQVNGRLVLKDGTVICIYGTAYGDGVYLDKRDREYYVDSGTLGCVNTKHLKKSLLKKAPKSGSQVIDMPVSFSCHERDGVITLGSVVINTSHQGDGW